MGRSFVTVDTMDIDPADVGKFPSFLDHPRAWTGHEYLDETRYIYQLSTLELRELNNALSVFKSLGLDGDLVCRQNFPLPTLSHKLDRLHADVHSGKGFGLIRGLDPSQYSSADLTILYLGIQSYVANRRGRQDAKGNMLVHIVADDSSQLTSQHTRHSTSGISFHNEEAGDTISWLTRNVSALGGECIIASAYTIYNTLVDSHPDLVTALTQPTWVFNSYEARPRPILFFHGGEIVVNFGRIPLIGNEIHPRPPHLPAVTKQQLRALDAIEDLASKVQLEIKTRPGDIHFINNLFILHRRKAFSNGGQALDCRHLVRMRLQDDGSCRELPSQLKKQWSDSFDEASLRVWHIDPMPSGYFPLRSYPN